MVVIPPATKSAGGNDRWRYSKARQPWWTTAPTNAGLSDRTARFIARLDGYLLALPDDAARCTFLDRQLEGWEHRYARFVATEGASEPIANPADPPQAADFLLTITALASQRDALGGHRTRHGRTHA